jgi:hypothetical protein
VFFKLLILLSFFPLKGIKEACPSPGLKFGFLGVNWKGHHSLSTESGDTAEYMSLPWDMSSDDGDKSTLVSLLGATSELQCKINTCCFFEFGITGDLALIVLV